MKQRNNNPKGKKRGDSPMDAALRHLTGRARSRREMERYLDECQYGEVEVMETVQRLMELNLVNDRAFAEEFIRTRLNTRPVSRNHLREQLLAHQVEEEAVVEALNAVLDQDEEENAKAVAEKYLRQLSDLPPEERRNRVVKRLLSRGYSYEVTKTAIDQAELESGEDA